MSGELFLSRYQVLWEEMKAGKTVENPVLELLCRQYPGFVDSKNTIIIIDEIQESSITGGVAPDKHFAFFRSPIFRIIIVIITSKYVSFSLLSK